MSILKSFVIASAIIILIAIGYLIFEATTAVPNINSFTECIEAVYPLQKTIPPTCQTSDGQLFTEKTLDENINSFTECIAAGYPIMESYPAQCRTSNGKSFTQDITNDLNKSNLILVNSPLPNALIKSPLTITGEAKGQWFFEATFPVTLVDDNDQELARTFAEASGDWMTENFVKFESQFSFLPPKTPTGKIILEKANPSGLAEQNDSISIPVKFADFQPVTSNPRAQNGCVITGCSKQICANQETPSTCEYQEIYACYQNAVCGRSTDTGQCQWQDSPDLGQCLDKFTN